MMPRPISFLILEVLYEGFQIGGKLVMECSRSIMVKLLLFQSGGCGLPQDGAMPSFFPDSKSSILGPSIDVQFVL